jgi:hypothetical protein
MQVVGLRHVAYSTRFAENYPRFKERQHRAWREKTNSPCLEEDAETEPQKTEQTNKVMILH